MSNEQSNRRKFLKLMGLTAGATIAAPAAMANFVDAEEIKKLTPEQQEFMIRYGAWMDEMTELAKTDKLDVDRDNSDNQEKRRILVEKAGAMKPELTAFMEDPIFAVVYKESIKRLSKEI